MTDFGPYTMRGLRTCKARNGVAWSATILRNREWATPRAIGTVMDAGNGGALRLDLKPGEEPLLAAHAAAQPYPEVAPGAMHDTDTFLAALADWTEAQARARRLLRTHVVMVGSDGRCRTVKLPAARPGSWPADMLAARVDPAAPDAIERVARALCGGAP